jgi:hypothetical protein
MKSSNIVTLKISGATNIRFTGDLIASNETSANNAAGRYYSGDPGRWAEYALYKTNNNKYVCHCIYRTCWDGERDSYDGLVCESEQEVIEFFGQSWLAQELYDEANIDNTSDI